jgi:hypothetical protein
MQILSVCGVHEAVAAVVQPPRKRLPFPPTAFCWAFTACLRLPPTAARRSDQQGRAGVPAFRRER